MNNALLTQGLMIAAIGMGLVFVVIIFLWGLMALLMRLTSGPESPRGEHQEQEGTDFTLVPEFTQTTQQRRAAAAAVAVSLALASQGLKSGGSKQDKGGEVSAWQAYHRSRRIRAGERRG